MLKVQRLIKFYVTHRDSVVAGLTTPYYQMLGQMDLTQDQYVMGAFVRQWNLMGIKALFR